MSQKLLFTLVTLLVATSHQAKAGLSPEITDECLNNPSSKVNAMVDLPAIDPSIFTGGLSRAAIQDSLVDILKRESALTQAPVITGIQAISPDTDIQTFWVTNKIALANAPCAILPGIALIPGVMNVRKEAIFNLQALEVVAISSVPEVRATNPQWGVAKINAPSVWEDTKNPTTGTGIVVANIDSGVRSTHEALKGNYRGGDFSWFDGVKNSSDGVPIDENGHGTHVMGTICGQNGIGVAPNATWIACRGCDGTGSCAEVPLTTCGEWIMCPYTLINGTKVSSPNCTARPKIVNNSWGGSIPIGGDFYNKIIENWRSVGIIPFFAAGNSGPACFTTGSPANQKIVISSVGATNQDDTIAYFSSKGPSTAGPNPFQPLVKPEISAPGAKIVSSWNTTDTAYATLDGTSMASPHAAGAAALLLAKNSSLTYEQLMTVLEKTAVQPSSANTCTCDVSNPLFCWILPKKWPNNVFGYGRIDVAAAFKTV